MIPEEVFGKNYSAFEELDPFNNLTLKGFISRKPNQYYGALIITHVNSKPVKTQLIMGTPKMGYPFDRTGKYNFPSVKYVEIFEKLDGTNILGFTYIDHKGFPRISYKTRLRPTLSSSRFGNFLSMWKEMLVKYPDIPNMIKKNKCNISFELYGFRNPHLLIYSTPLDAAILFGVTNSGNVISPTNLSITGIPIVPLWNIIDKDYVWNYEQLQKDIQSKLKKVEEYYEGNEGAVWYLHLPDGKVTQIKAKPETIETIHFSAGGKGLNKEAIKATCWNALENTDTLTVEFIKELLLEEFDKRLVDMSTTTIEKSIAIVTSEMEFREKVLIAYEKTSLNINLNKREVMRKLSKQFERKQMKKVYSIISSFS